MTESDNSVPEEEREEHPVPAIVTGEQVCHFIHSLPLAEDMEVEGGKIPWGGELNKRLAFELAEVLGRDGARGLQRFANLVAKYTEAS